MLIDNEINYMNEDFDMLEDQYSRNIQVQNNLLENIENVNRNIVEMLENDIQDLNNNNNNNIDSINIINNVINNFLEERNNIQLIRMMRTVTHGHTDLINHIYIQVINDYNIAVNDSINLLEMSSTRNIFITGIIILGGYILYKYINNNNNIETNIPIDNNNIIINRLDTINNNVNNNNNMLENLLETYKTKISKILTNLTLAGGFFTFIRFFKR